LTALAVLIQVPAGSGKETEFFEKRGMNGLAGSELRFFVMLEALSTNIQAEQPL